METARVNKQYKYFTFDSVFDYKRGRRYKTEDHSVGDVAYISSSGVNNGVDNYVSPPNFMTEYENKITFANSGSVCSFFYHPYKFVASDHVMVVWIKDKELTKNIALFLKPIFEKLKYKYSFGREVNSDRLPKETLYLPIDRNGQPDWEYMENFIEIIRNKIQFTPIKTKNANLVNKLVNVSKWKEFSYTDKRLWDRITHGQRLIAEDRISGDVDYYSASEFDNSLTDQINNPLFTEQNCIVYNTFASAFYVEGEFTASDEIYCFHNPRLNKYNALFITTMMKQNKYKFKFGRKAFYNKFKNETLLLPATEDNKPDWIFMEDYIKSLPYSDLI